MCAWMCLLYTVKQTQTEWQAKMWRQNCISAHVLWQSASGDSDPLITADDPCVR